MITLDTTKELEDQLNLFANFKNEVSSKVNSAISDYEAQLEVLYKPSGSYRFSESGKQEINTLNKYVDELTWVLGTLDSYFLDSEINNPNKNSIQTSILRRHNIR